MLRVSHYPGLAPQRLQPLVVLVEWAGPASGLGCQPLGPLVVQLWQARPLPLGQPQLGRLLPLPQGWPRLGPHQYRLGWERKK